MRLDTSLLSAQYGLLLMIGFVVTYGVLLLLYVVHTRVLGKRNIIYVTGSVVITSCSISSFYILGLSALWLGVALAGLLALLSGTLDERKRLSVAAQLIAQISIAAIVVTGGWIIRYVSNPSGQGVLYLDWFTIGPWMIPGSIATLLWLVFHINAINWLDGIDGLAASVGSVALLTLAAMSLLPQTQDARTLALAIAALGTLLGFLVWNWPPAYMYLGTSGSWFLGLYIGMIAIVGGGKVVTTLLVLSLPALDAALVITQRLMAGRAPWHGDSKRHLHYRLLAAGLSPTEITILLTGISAILGMSALVLQTQQKIWMLLIVGVILGGSVAVLAYRQRLTGPKF